MLSASSAPSASTAAAAPAAAAAVATALYCWLVLLGVLFFPSQLPRESCTSMMDVVRTLRKAPGTNTNNIYEKMYVATARCAAAVVSAAVGWCSDERIRAPVLHDASQIDYCRY